MPNFQDVLDAARTLNATERVRLADALWEDLPPEDWPPPSAAWIAEAQKRSSAFDREDSSAGKWPEVRDRARQRAGVDE